LSQNEKQQQNRELNNLDFNSFSFESQIAAGISAVGYTPPTLLQAQAIPKTTKGHDLMGMTRTGTGKTAALVLPTLERLLPGRSGRLREPDIASTSELVEQIRAAIETRWGHAGPRIFTVYRNVGSQPQTQKREPADIVVTCPGRLHDHIGPQTVDLSRLEALVLDEADQMFDMGFCEVFAGNRASGKGRSPDAAVFCCHAASDSASGTGNLVQDILKRPERGTG